MKVYRELKLNHDCRFAETQPGQQTTPAQSAEQRTSTYRFCAHKGKRKTSEQRQRFNSRNANITYPESSACTRAKGFAMLGDAGPALVIAAAALPPPPRRGLAIRPKLNDEELAAFCAKRSQMFQPKTTVDHNL